MQLENEHQLAAEEEAAKRKAQGISGPVKYNVTSATSPEPAAAPEPAAGSTLPASSREIEVRRRMATQELYTDEGPQ